MDSRETTADHTKEAVITTATVLTHLWDIVVQIIIFIVVVVGAMAFVFSLRADAEEFTNYAVVFAICTATVVAMVVHI